MVCRTMNRSEMKRLGRHFRTVHRHLITWLPLFDGDHDSGEGLIIGRLSNRYIGIFSPGWRKPSPKFVGTGDELPGGTRSASHSGQTRSANAYDIPMLQAAAIKRFSSEAINDARAFAAYQRDDAN